MLDTSSGKMKQIIVDQIESMETPLAHLLPGDDLKYDGAALHSYLSVCFRLANGVAVLGVHSGWYAVYDAGDEGLRSPSMQALLRQRRP